MFHSFAGRDLLHSNTFVKNKFLLKNRANPRTAAPQIAKVTDVNEISGIITCEWLTASDTTGENNFKVPTSVPQIGSQGSHFFGGQYDVGDVVYVSTVTREGNRTSYRLITSSVSFLYQQNHENGAYPLLRAGEKLIQAKGGGFTFWSQAGSIFFNTGYRSPREQLYRTAVNNQQVTNDPMVVHQRDYLNLWADIHSGDNSPLRMFESTFNHTHVQWGQINRISEVGNTRTFDRISETDSEFKVSIVDEDRRKEYASLFVGTGFKLSGVPITTINTNSHTIGGFWFNNEKFATQPGLLFDTFGRFDLTDSFDTSIFSDAGDLSILAKKHLLIQANSGAIVEIIGKFTETASSKVSSYRNFSVFVDNDYTEQLHAQHQVVRLDSKYVDTINFISNLTASYKWSITPSDLANFEIQPEKIIFGTGKTVNINLSATINSIKHSVANEINAPQNFFGVDAPNVSEPLLLGTKTITMLSALMAALDTLNSTLEAFQNNLSVFLHLPGWAAVIDPTHTLAIGSQVAAVASDTAGTAYGTMVGTLADVTAQIQGLISHKNFTE